MSMIHPRFLPSLAATVLLAAPGAASAPQQLSDPSTGTLELVTPNPLEQAKLNLIDGLAFDAFGNLFGVKEIFGGAGGAVYVDKAAGVVTVLVSGISRSDQIALHPSGDLFVTSEISPASATNRVYRMTVGYDANDVPQAASTTAAGLATSLAITTPEGLIVLESASAYGSPGDLYVAEDRTSGRILRVEPGTGTATVLIAGLARPEGMAFGDFGGALPPALYVAETSRHNVLRIAADGTKTVVGDPTLVGLFSPDNLEFGPDGFLYVSEDRPSPTSRIIRIAADGTHSVFATGFGQAQGMAFEPVIGDLYVSEQDFDRIWRVRFAHAGYGCGTNPAGSLVELGGSPAIGQTWTLGVDNPLGTQAAGSLAFLAISSLPDPAFPCGTPLSGWGMSAPGADGELLVAASPPNPLVTLGPTTWAGAGSPAPFALAIPPNPALVGSFFYLQGLIVDLGGPSFGLTEALRVLVGP